MRLIDADALINTLQELFDKREKEARFTGDRGVTVTWNDAIYHIKTAPTAQQEETFEFGKWYDFGKGYVLEVTTEAFRISQVRDKEGDINERDN